MEWTVRVGKIKQASSAVWLYLNQSVFEPDNPTVWEPNRFWYLYKIQHLKNCLYKDSESESRYTQ